jgi:ribulose-bisphosphate carboxylase small chain
MFEIDECRKVNTTGYSKVQAFDASKGCVHSFIIQRPKVEPGFYVQPTEAEGRFQRYIIQSYAVQAKPAGHRY